MTTSESLEKFGLVPSDDSLPVIRALLAREAELERNDEEREEDLALLCCVQLFACGHVEDSLLIWEAKGAGFDLGCYLDMQFLCGAGLEETLQFLAVQSSPKAFAALEYIQKCIATRDFESFTPNGHLDRYREYFKQ